MNAYGSHYLSVILYTGYGIGAKTNEFAHLAIINSRINSKLILSVQHFAVIFRDVIVIIIICSGSPASSNLLPLPGTELCM